MERIYGILVSMLQRLREKWQTNMKIVGGVERGVRAGRCSSLRSFRAMAFPYVDMHHLGNIFVGKLL